MQILLLGKVGQLGWELNRTLATLGKVITLDFPEVNLAHPEGLPEIIQSVQPEVIINATAYTAVDRAESEPELALAINGTAPGILAEAARTSRSALIHFSTDYVFDGVKSSPYLESDPPNPLSVYGSSKLAGEQAILQAGGAAMIFRTSWVYSLRRDSFVTKVLGWARKNRQLSIVADQVSNPTWARMLAEITAQLLATHSAAGDSCSLYEWFSEHRGIYHLAGSGFTSRLDWARAILSLDPHLEQQVVEELIPARTSDFPSPAERPLFSALNCDRFTQAFGLRLPDWQDALQLAMQDA
ncbi:MAG: dTDP-4-dehydrorhamnose reductase [Anaerolineales bacterium]|jgi:dTDP-4-dehydrorhamnose reductase|nr:dTDP-4-dehydrorhamnose reductase [Anaerolineales bacterium]